MSGGVGGGDRRQASGAGGGAGAGSETACGQTDGARDTGAGPVLPRRGPGALTSPGPGPGCTSIFVHN